MVALVSAASLALTSAALGAEVGNAGGDLRNGWYPDEGSITPGLVTGSTWGKLWTAPVDGQVYAQPLLAPSGTLLVTTETDHVYGLDPATGSQKWTANLASANGPWNPADVGCSDLVPWRGSTATPVIDTSTNTAYLTYKTYDASHKAVWYMDARSISTGQEVSGWPVQLSGTADNDASLTFDSQDQDQRPGLLLMNGVVYAGFGSICDTYPFDGWVFGVSTSTHKVTARWASVTNGTGGGVWQAGVGLTSDGPGSILIATGNEGAPTAASPGSSPPSSCGECIIRLNVQPDGTLKPVDFFAPFDAAQLDQYDADFGSGGVVGLPDQYFGTTSLPHLAVAVGKEGYVYLLNRDSLGGYEQANGGDDVVQRLGPFGGVWGRPGVWPGDGGYVYIPTECCQNGGGELDVYKYGLDGSGDPSLAQVAHSSDAFGFGSGSPVITSDGTASGSALVWIIWATNRQGNNGQLRAYDPVPVNGQPQEVWSASIGNATNYSIPGVGAGRLYVGTRDGQVLAFGSPVTQPLGGGGLSFPRTTTGQSSTQTLTMTANKTVTINSLSLGGSPSQFSWASPSQPLPATLTTGQQFSVQVSFNPTVTGAIGDQLTAHTDAGDVSFALSGTGQVQGPHLEASAPVLSLGGTQVGGHLTGSVIFTDDGSQAITIQGVQPPNAPFSTSDAPSAGTVLGPGDSITVDVAFDPTSDGQFNKAIALQTNGNDVSVALSAYAAPPGNLQFSSEAIDFGSTPVGSTATRSFTITNTGGLAVTIEKSKPPFGGAFTANTSLPEGTTVAAGQTLTETVRFSPTATGPAASTWLINGDDGSGLHQIQFTGTGASPASPPSAGGSGGTRPPVAKKASLPAAPKFQPGVASTAHLGSIYVTYKAKRAGVSRFVLQRAVVGRRGAHGCVASTARNRGLAACTRFVTVASFTHRDRAGATRLRLGAYVALRKLGVGRYRLHSVLLDSAGAKHSFATPLRIITPQRRHTTRSVAPAVAPLIGLLGRLAALLSL